MENLPVELYLQIISKLNNENDIIKMSRINKYFKRFFKNNIETISKIILKLTNVSINENYKSYNQLYCHIKGARNIINNNYLYLVNYGYNYNGNRSTFITIDKEEALSFALKNWRAIFDEYSLYSDFYTINDLEFGYPSVYNDNILFAKTFSNYFIQVQRYNSDPTTTNYLIDYKRYTELVYDHHFNADITITDLENYEPTRFAFLRSQLYLTNDQLNDLVIQVKELIIKKQRINLLIKEEQNTRRALRRLNNRHRLIE